MKPVVMTIRVTIGIVSGDDAKLSNGVVAIVMHGCL